MNLLDGKFLTMRLEDGEQVVRLRGGRGKRQWNSDRPHAGLWGQNLAYVLIPGLGQRSATTRSRLAQERYPDLQNRSGEGEVLLIGPVDRILELVTKGPLWCRAIPSRKGQPRTEAQQEAARKLAAG